MEKLLQQVIESTANLSGKDFLANICLQLNQIIKADYTFIARLDYKRYCSKTLTLIANGKVADNFEYSLEHTPCANVSDGSVCCYPKEVCSKFPKDQLLIDMGINGYLGTPLYSSKGGVMGLIVALYENEIQNEKIVLTLFQIFSGRISSEIERMEYETQLKEINEDLEERVKQRTEELEQAHKKLVESEKLAALGGLVSGIAHEINTPLGVSITASSYLHDSFSDFARKFEDQKLDKTEITKLINNYNSASELITNSLQRAKNLVNNFKKTAADQNHNEVESINILEYYKDVASTLKALLKKKHASLLIEGDEMLQVNTFPGAHAQILTILVSNSIQHGLDNNDNNEIHLKLSRNKHKFIVRYSDNGKGVKTEQRNKIFEPFYTSDRASGSTGLGLSILHNIIVKQLNGKVSIEPSEHGFSLEFTFKETSR